MSLACRDVRVRDGRREKRPGKVGAGALAHEQSQDRHGQHSDGATLAGAGHSLAEPDNRPCEKPIQQDEKQESGDRGEHDNPEALGASQQRDDVWNEPQIPEQVDVAAVQRGCGDFRIPADHEREPQRRDPPHHGPAKAGRYVKPEVVSGFSRTGRTRRRPEPRPGSHQQQDEGDKLDRQRTAPSNARGRPGALESQRRIQKEESGSEARKAEPAGPGLACLHGRLSRTRLGATPGKAACPQRATRRSGQSASRHSQSVSMRNE